MFNKTLEELEGKIWPEDEFGSNLTRTCCQLRKKPVDEFTVEDLRIMIGQSIGLQFLLPQAMELLDRNPAAEGDYYPGDLLVSVIRGGRPFLEAHRDIATRLKSIAHRFRAAHPSIDDTAKEIDSFLGQQEL